jgi:hypothetical protein
METFAEFFDNFLKERTDPVEDSDKKAPGDKEIPKVAPGTNIKGSDGFDEKHVRGAIGEDGPDKVDPGTDLKGSNSSDPVEDSDKKAPGDKTGECLKENSQTVTKASYTVL